HPGRAVSLTREGVLATAYGERTLVSLVLENLMSNADKYSPEGGPIDISLIGHADRIEVVVADRGIGVQSEKAETSFSPFYRTESAKGKASGMGLGLAVCRRVMEAQDGTIDYRARPGGGSEFSFTLPCAAAAEPSE